jgi:hypothetical protein
LARLCRVKMSELSIEMDRAEDIPSYDTFMSNKTNGNMLPAASSPHSVLSAIFNEHILTNSSRSRQRSVEVLQEHPSTLHTPSRPLPRIRILGERTQPHPLHYHHAPSKQKHSHTHKKLSISQWSSTLPSDHAGLHSSFLTSQQYRMVDLYCFPSADFGRYEKVLAVKMKYLGVLREHRRTTNRLYRNVVVPLTRNALSLVNLITPS